MLTIMAETSFGFMEAVEPFGEMYMARMVAIISSGVDSTLKSSVPNGAQDGCLSKCIERRKKMERRKLNDSECRMVFTLNTWTDELKEKAREYIDAGYYVGFGSTAIGHTLAEMVEWEGIHWAKQEYGKRIETVERIGWGDVYCHIKKNGKRYAIYKWVVTPANCSVDGKTHRRKLWYAGDGYLAGFYFHEQWEKKEKALIYGRKSDANKTARMIQKKTDENIMVEEIK